MQALYRHRLLDKLHDEPLRYNPDYLIVSYLEYRVAHGPINGNALLRCIRQVVVAVYKNAHGGDDSDLEQATIESHAHDILDSVSIPTLKTIATWEGEVSEEKLKKCLLRNTCQQSRHRATDSDEEPPAIL